MSCRPEPVMKMKLCSGDKHNWQADGTCSRCSAHQCVARKTASNPVGARCQRSTTANIEKRLCGIHRQMKLREQRKPEECKPFAALEFVLDNSDACGDSNRNGRSRALLN